MRTHTIILIIISLLLCAACTPNQPALQPTGVPAAQPSSTQVAAPTEERTITVAAVGDLMLGRYVGRRIATLGPNYPFSATGELLRADLVLGNLESPLTSRHKAADLRPGPYRLPADPAAVAGLGAAGFTALSLANNHALDAGTAGLEEAAQVMENAGIAPVGVGANREQAQQPRFVETNGLRVALLAANDVPDPADQPDEAQNWGRAPLDGAFLERVRAARSEADLVVVMVHWGVEYAATPGLRQREQADRLVEAGADVVLGAHPHVLQPITVIEREGRRALVAYSLGNFVFDQPFSPETSRSAVLHLTLGRAGLIDYRTTPVAIVDGQPRPLAPNTPEYAAVLHDLALEAAIAAPAPTGQPAPQTAATAPGVQPTASRAASAYAFDGTTFSPVPLPPDGAASSGETSTVSATADLRGNGSKLLLVLDANGMARLHEGSSTTDPVVWHNEADSWRVTQIIPGDADDDGRYEFLLILWKPDEAGVLRCHPFMLGWRGGRYRIFWGGSAVSEPIQAAALGDVDGEGHTELVVLEGGAEPGDEATSVGVWRWHGWGFERLWRAPAAGAANLEMRDITGDGTSDIMLRPTP